jgi:sigma-B regulation protein RsbU (phosphoserine phosphatase)
VIWGGGDKLEIPSDGLVEQLDAAAHPEEIVGRLAALSHLAPLVRDLNRELSAQQRLGQQVNRYFEEIDKEMRMAGRLQQHFLPRALPQTARLRFASLYRPATWVSGDIFDVFQIDEQTLGLFIADAMGHGTAAGLMTMFLRKALAPKRASGAFYSITPPTEAMADLHQAVVEQELPNSQFVTAAYATLDQQTLELCLARAGHPYPIVINAQGAIRELRCEGGLLGLPDIRPEFEETRVHLASGDRLVLYTDGIEDLFIAERDRVTGATRFTPLFEGIASSDAQGLVDQLAWRLDRREGSLNPEDDVTVIVVQID